MRHTQNTFTFIELLISVTIISFLGIVIYSVFANGITAWRRGNKDRTYARNIRLITEKVVRELRNTFKFSNIAFEGTEDSIMFPALIRVESKTGQGQTESHYEVGRLAFFYDDKENALCEEEKTYGEVFNEEKIGKGKVLIRHLRKLEFSYCYLDNATGDYKWKRDWKKEEQDSIPQAVKIKMVFEKSAGRQDLEKTIFIPIGTGRQKIKLDK